MYGPIWNEYKKVSTSLGDASAVKLIQSIYTRGIAGLFIELLQVAHVFNVHDLVINSLNETMLASNFEQTMNRLVTSTSIHSSRRAIELDGSIQMLEAARGKLELSNRLNFKHRFQGKTPVHWIEIIAAIEESGLEKVVHRKYGERRPEA